MSSPFDEENKATDRPKIANVSFSNDLVINWDNTNGEILKDSVWNNNIVNRFEKVQQVLVEKLIDEHKTKAVSCTNEVLTIGDIAFAVIDDVVDLPYYKIVKVRCDVFNFECSYPVGYFNSMDNKEKAIQERVSEYLEYKKL